MPKKKVRVNRTEEFDEELPENEEEEEEDDGPKRKTKLPKIVEDILLGEITEVPPAYQDWSMHLMRWAPKYTSDNKWELITGRIRKIDTLTPYKDVEEVAESEHGGGTYHVNVLNEKGQIVTRRKFIIEGLPKVTREDMRHTTEKSPLLNNDDKEEGADYWRKKKEEYEAKAEAMEAKKQYEKMSYRESEEEEDEDDYRPVTNPFMVPSMTPPYQGPGYVNEEKLRQKIEKEVFEKFSRLEEEKEKNREIEVLRSELKELRLLLTEKANAPDNGFTMKDAMKIMSDMTNKVLEARQATIPPASEDSKMSAFAAMITQAMQGVNTMMMNTMQQTASAQQEILMQSIKNAMAPPGERDWKLELINKGADTMKEFVGSIVDANKSRNEVEKKKLELYGNIKPVMIPKNMVKTPQQSQAQQPPQPRQPRQAQQPPQPRQPEYQEVTEAQAREIMQRAEKLQHEAIAAYLSGQSPAFFARKTLQIAGQEVTNWLRENPNLETLRQLAHEQKGDAGLQEFDKYITNNPQARGWVEQWLGGLTETFHRVDKQSGEPIQQATQHPRQHEIIQGNFKVEEPEDDGDEEDEYLDIDDYEELPGDDFEKTEKKLGQEKGLKNNEQSAESPSNAKDKVNMPENAVGERTI